MKFILSLIIGGVLIVSGFGQTRNVLVGTNNVVVQPTNFWSADAVNARSGLGLGTASTNPASAFQPASTNLTLLATGDGSSLTNLNLSGLGTIGISNISGLQSALDSKLATNGSAINLTNFPAIILQTTSALSNFPSGLLRTNGDGSGLTNLPVPATASNVLSTIQLDKGGTGATNASGARINLGGTAIGTNIFMAPNAATVRTNIGLGWSVLTNNNSTNFRNDIGLGVTSIPTFNGISFESGDFSISNEAIYWSGMIRYEPETQVLYGDVSFDGGSLSIIGTNAAAKISATRTNLGLPWSGLTNTNPSSFRSALEIGSTNSVTFGGVTASNITAQNLTITAGSGITLQSTLTNASSFRTNIGLPWAGLTNSSASAFRTALELGTAATNNATVFQSSSSTLSNLATSNGGSLTNLQSTNIVGVIPSSNISTVNFTNIVGTLSIASGGTSATNSVNARQNLGSTTVGDAVFTATNAAAARTALALGTAATSSVTSFQPADADLTNLAANNAINLTNFPVSLLRTNGNGSGLTNISVSNVSGIVAITNGGSGSSTVGGARTNFGLGAPWLTNSNVTNFRSAIGLGNNDVVQFNQINVDELQINAAEIIGWESTINLEEARLSRLGIDFLQWGNSNKLIVGVPIEFNTTTNAAITRTNIGLGATNNVTFNNITSQAIMFGDANAKIETVSEDDGVAFVLKRGTNEDVSLLNLGFTNNTIHAFIPIGFNNTTNAATTRTNLGLPLTALTNTNAANFMNAIGVTGGNVLSNGVVVSRSYVVWDGANDQWGFYASDDGWYTRSDFVTTNAPTNATNPAAWLIINIEASTNSYKLPLYK